jgi:hypothetical protein
MGAQEAATAIRREFTAIHGRAPTDRELLILLSHAQIESGWGAGSYLVWPMSQPNPPRIGDKTAPRRGNTHNWGAVQWTGPGPGVEDQDWFYGLDTHADGQPYRAKIRLYPDDSQGARDFVLNATKYRGRDKTVLPYLDRGDPYDYAQRSRASGYFELAADKAGAAFLSAAKSLSAKLGLPPPVVGAGGAGGALTADGAGFAGLAALVFVGAALAIYSRKTTS